MLKGPTYISVHRKIRLKCSLTSKNYCGTDQNMSFDLSTTARNRSDLDKLELCCPDQLINPYSFSLNNHFDG